jgi:Zn-finger protein
MYKCCLETSSRVSWAIRLGQGAVAEPRGALTFRSCRGRRSRGWRAQTCSRKQIQVAWTARLARRASQEWQPPLPRILLEPERRSGRLEVALRCSHRSRFLRRHTQHSPPWRTACRGTSRWSCTQAHLLRRDEVGVILLEPERRSGRLEVALRCSHRSRFLRRTRCVEPSAYRGTSRWSCTQAHLLRRDEVGVSMRCRMDHEHSPSSASMATPSSSNPTRTGEAVRQT